LESLGIDEKDDPALPDSSSAGKVGQKIQGVIEWEISKSEMDRANSVVLQSNEFGVDHDVNSRHVAQKIQNFRERSPFEIYRDTKMGEFFFQSAGGLCLSVSGNAEADTEEKTDDA
jgi:hypothetical protein